jgi:hypothetical protein
MSTLRSGIFLARECSGPIGDEMGQWQEVNGGPYAPGPGRPNKRACLFPFLYFGLFMFLSIFLNTVRT